MNWTINGRFLTQATTGVQRYAREMVLALDNNTMRQEFQLLAPPGAGPLQGLTNIAVTESGWGSGHVWEQASLPLNATDGLLSLCNTGPVLARRQIVCIHDANVWTFSSSYSFAFRSFYKMLLPTLGRRSAKILTVSRSSADALIAYGIAPASKIEVVPNGHEHTSRWDSGRSRLFTQTSVPRRPFVFALGSRAPHKNLGLLLKIAPKLDEIGLDLYVSGGSFGIFSSGDAVETPANVRMLGYVSDDDLALLYKNALCLAFPSFVEGFGLPLVEAMSFGCPIVSSHTSCMPEICGDYASYADPNDADAWVKAIGGLVDNAETKSDPADRLALYSWPGSAAQLNDLVHNL